MSTTAKTLEALANREYKWGFVSDIEADALPPGLNEDVVRAITQRLLPGQRVELTIVRGKARKSVTVVLGERPATPPRLNR